MQKLLYAWTVIGMWVSLFPSIQAQTLCSLQESCDSCLAADFECVWCTDMILNISTTNRCMLRSNMTGCNDFQDRKGNLTLEENDSFSQQIQIRPQRVRAVLRPGESMSFTATVKPAPNFPLDLYYLMDLSNSMRDDLNSLRGLSAEIANSIRSISNDSQLGFGSFVDKPVSPYIETTIGRLEHPCSDLQCVPAYSFYHILNLTTDTERFRTLIEGTTISGNLDSPEGGLDALLQAAVCTDIIGWRERARHLLLMATDADFHSAGDGRLGGVVRPNEGMCYLYPDVDESFTYTNAIEFDYPSVHQINDVLVRNNIVPLFAVTGRTRNNYDRLVSNDTQQGPIENLYIGELDSDSANVVELISNAYRSIAETIQVRGGTANNVRITASATCPNQTEDGQCTNVLTGTEVTYNVTVELLDCTPINEEQFLRFVFYGDIVIEIEPVCTCECSSQPMFNSSFCNDQTLTCGQCICNGRQGSMCECLPTQTTFVNTDLCKRSNTSEVICSNRGSCICGQCVCEVQQNPDDIVYGQFCECDNFNCPRGSDNAVCGGPTQGTCECGSCVCARHPNGELWTRGATGVCDCTPDQESCRAANGQVCAGNGDCICGRCTCPTEYTVASNCLSCNDPSTCNALCGNYFDCVTNYRQLGEEICRNGNETDVPLVPINTTLSGNYIIEGVQGTPCSVPYDGCITTFYVAVDRDGNVQPIHVQIESTCPEAFTLWYVPPLVILLALIIALVVALIILKVILSCLDAREYKQFTNNLHLEKQEMQENPLFQSGAEDDPVFKKYGKHNESTKGLF